MHRALIHTLVAGTTAAVVTGTAVLAASTPAGAADSVRVRGPLVSYDATLVPAEASARVRSVETSDGRTIVTLKVRGLVPNRPYGAHAHNLACGPAGGDAGAHYQRVQDPLTLGDPKKASVDPAYANPANEIWLDLVTDEEGNGSARAVVAWQMPAERRAASVVLHTRHTDGTGAAGARLGCLTVPF